MTSDRDKQKKLQHSIAWYVIFSPFYLLGGIVRVLIKIARGLLSAVAVPIWGVSELFNYEQVPEELSGREFEEYCAAYLRKNGYKNVVVTKGSGDQGIDIIAEKKGLRYGFQCKYYSTPLGNKPIQEAYAGKAIYDCDVAVVMTNSTFTKGAIEAADLTGVRLIEKVPII